jgi:hypothetical protein
MSRELWYMLMLGGMYIVVSSFLTTISWFVVKGLLI